MMTLYLGYMLDMIFGDPYGLPHPVRWIGKFIETLVKPCVSKPLTKRGQLLAGSFITLITVGLVYAVAFCILWVCSFVSPMLRFVVETVMIFQILATCSLGKEAEKIYQSLKSNNINLARKQIAMLVSRDTKEMSVVDICKATIETVSENFADGVIAPLLFIVIGGAPLGWAYKAVNTLDSMIGYKNEKYLYLGRTSAILDDVVNFFPARLSVCFIVITSVLMRLNTKQCVAIIKRDHKNHSSPNSAWPESAFAGALDIQLGGQASYFGKKEMKPTMGDANLEVNHPMIRKAIRLMYNASFVGLLILSGIQWLIRQ